MAKDVALTVKDGIGWLTLLRPETRNAMDAELMEAAVAALGTLPDGIGALVLAGDGLACACDLRVVGASTVFVPAFGALGLSPDSGTSFHLTRALGGPAAIAASSATGASPRPNSPPAAWPTRWPPMATSG